jgi:acyl dehydratase
MNTSTAKAVPRGGTSRFWEDLELGETTRSRDMLVDREAMIEFAGKYDPQYFHTDGEAAKDSLFGGLIGGGIYSAALWRILDHEANGAIAFCCGVAWDNVKWRRPLRAGDRVHATSKIIMLRPSEKRADVGVATLHHELVRQDGEAVLVFDSVDLVYRRNRG